MGKQWWQDQKKPVKPWIIDKNRDPCNDSQWAKLRQTGYSEKQGPTYYCPICRWAFWPVKMIPSTEQVNYEKLTNPNATSENMSYIKLCNKPPRIQGQKPEYTMMMQLGKLSPDFLTEELKEYWLDKYCEKYPSTEIAIRRKKYKEKLKEAYNRN